METNKAAEMSETWLTLKNVALVYKSSILLPVYNIISYILHL